MATKKVSGVRPVDKRIVQLKITLRHTKPVVWRRIQVPADTTFRALADMLIAAVGFYGGHLHLFTVDGERIGNTEFDDMGDWTSDKRVRLGAVVDQGIRTFSFDYDFGDGWEHKVDIEEILSADPSEKYPVCIGGKNAGPPEDCGGPGGFEDLKEKIANPKHPEHAEIMEWLERPYDPKAFDPEHATSCFMKRRKISPA